MRKLTTGTKFWAELEVLPHRTLRVKRANKYTRLNQFRARWLTTNARNLARIINSSKLVIK